MSRALVFVRLECSVCHRTQDVLPGSQAWCVRHGKPVEMEPEKGQEEMAR